MKKNTKVGITFTILTVLVLGIGIVFAVLINNEKTKREDIATIRRVYSSLNGDVIDIYHYRSSLDEKFASYTEETYAEEHQSYVELLTKYNEEVVSLNNNLAILEDKCSKEYDDAETNIFCSYYQQLYETTNNIYVNQLKKYNENITNYNQNEENEQDFELFELINKEIIDFDKNGVYEGQN